MKKIKYMALALIMAATSIVPVFADSIDLTFERGSLDYKIGEETKKISEPIYAKNDKIMVPIEYIDEAFQLEEKDVQWNQYDDSLTIYSGNKIIQMKIGDNTMYTDNGRTMLSVAPERKNLVYMFPIEDIAKEIGVKYKEDNGKITFQIEKVESVDAYDYNYESLLQIAYKNSKDLKKVDLSIEKAEELLDDARDDVKSVPKGIGNGGINGKKNSEYRKFRSQEFAKEKAKRDVDTTKEKIQYELEGAYYNLLKAMEDKELAQMKVDVFKDTMNQTNIKFENGMASEYEKNKAERSYKEAEKTYEMAKKSEQIAYEALNYFVGLSADSRYELDKNITMKELKDYEIDVESHIPSTINNSPDIWALEEQIELGELGLRLFVFNVGTNYEATKIDVQTSKINLRHIKEKYEESLRKLNTSIKTLEDKYESDTIAHEKAKDDYELAQLNETLGLAIPLDVKKAELQLENTKNTLSETIRTYNKTVEAYLKPWVAPQ
ncbi:MAG: stalk domain-containing protein [Anaeromicrobium sp.]|jgi:outer membrane protein TolC|uniref:stalk domain-containing protein n=1 Tax=Anaeromicrobium sp. TaxID=1929132 RepID=UPI0025F39B84|nr:stalk domain-containing protein [Anaeromicrobium sp.]MCT4592736.1 stalk domain-containing protein [Anaeromicrobium sp.]